MTTRHFGEGQKDHLHHVRNFAAFLGRSPDGGDLVRRLTLVQEPRRAPIVLSPEEVARLLAAASASNTSSVQRGLRRRFCASPRLSF
jgi:site-specific recombinase XerD